MAARSGPACISLSSLSPVRARRTVYDRRSVARDLWAVGRLGGKIAGRRSRQTRRASPRAPHGIKRDIVEHNQSLLGRHRPTAQARRFVPSGRPVGYTRCGRWCSARRSVGGGAIISSSRGSPAFFYWWSLARIHSRWHTSSFPGNLTFCPAHISLLPAGDGQS